MHYSIQLTPNLRTSFEVKGFQTVKGDKQQILFVTDIQTGRNREGTGAAHNINNGSVPLSCASESADSNIGTLAPAHRNGIRPLRYLLQLCLTSQVIGVSEI